MCALNERQGDCHTERRPRNDTEQGKCWEANFGSTTTDQASGRHGGSRKVSLHAAGESELTRIGTSDHEVERGSYSEQTCWWDNRGSRANNFLFDLITDGNSKCTPLASMM